VTPPPVTPPPSGDIWYAKNFGTIDVNGSTDCTATVQKAVEACTKAGGGIVQLPAGRLRTYAAHTVCPDVGGSIDLKDGVHLRGEGVGKTFIIGTRANIHPIAAGGRTNIGVSDLEIYGTASGIDGVKFYGCNDIVIRNVVAHDLYQGIACYGAHNALIEDCTVYKCTDGGINTGEPALGVQQGLGNLVRRCVAHDCARGFKFTGWPPPQTSPKVASRANGTSYEDCTATNNTCGFYAEYAQNGSWTDCVSNGVKSGMHPYELRGLIGGVFTRCTGSGATPVIFPCTWSDVLKKDGACARIVVDGKTLVA
jgi:hypothetical protein